MGGSSYIHYGLGSPKQSVRLWDAHSPESGYKGPVKGMSEMLGL